MVLPRDFVYEISDNMSMEAAGEAPNSIHQGTCSFLRIAIIEPLSVAWHAVKTSPFKKGDSALVLGAGPIGLAVVQVLAAKDAKDIIVSEVAARRREFAKSLGAKYVLNPVQEDVVGKVREICDGVGANVAFDTAGVQVGLDQAVQAIRTRGTLVNIAVWEKTATIMPNSLVFREKRYMGVATHQRGDFQEVIDAIGTGESFKLRKSRAMLTDNDREPQTGIDDNSEDQDGRD